MMTPYERWRLILGSKAEEEDASPLNEVQQGIDNLLEALYDADRKGGLGASSPNINRWLGDIRKYFPSTVVQVMQKDALERLGLDRMLMEPELLAMVEPDVHLVATLLSLKKVIPNKTKDTAREVVRKVVQEVEKKLAYPLREAIQGALSKSVHNRRPKLREMDWHRTIRANLRNYQPSLQTIIPEQLRGHGRRGQSLRHVILMLDQSGSMSDSVVYGGILGAVMASVHSIQTHIIAFDTSVVDLTGKLPDPVDLLFGVQLGGGTDIQKAVAYAETLVRNPAQTILILLSDLYEGGPSHMLMKRITTLHGSGVQIVVLLALSDQGAPAYDKDVAAKLAAMEIPVFACTPDQFPDMMAKAIKKEKLP